MKSLATLFVLNVTLFTLLCLSLRLIGKALGPAIRFMSLLIIGTPLALSRYLYRQLHRAGRASTRSRKTSRTTVVEDDDAFESWESFSRRCKIWETHDGVTSQLCHAFTILGVPPFSTEREIRKSYLALMKRYHPDRFMHASPAEREQVRDAALAVREAYDTVTRLLCQVQ